jgi:hypothetical protein
MLESSAALMTQLNQGRSTGQSGRGAHLPIFACWGFIASSVALFAGMAPQSGISGVEQHLASLSRTWDQVVPVSAVAHPTARQPIIGDEGFWLSRQDLAGQTTGFVGVGDRMTLATQVLTGGQTAAKTTVFEVIELKPLSRVSPPLSAAGADTHPGATPAPVLTIVTCREQSADTAHPPRIVRFLIEAAPASHVPPPTPRSL